MTRTKNVNGYALIAIVASAALAAGVYGLTLDKALSIDPTAPKGNCAYCSDAPKRPGGAAGIGSGERIEKPAPAPKALALG